MRKKIVKEIRLTISQIAVIETGIHKLESLSTKDKETLLTLIKGAKHVILVPWDKA